MCTETLASKWLYYAPKITGALAQTRPKEMSSLDKTFQSLCAIRADQIVDGSTPHRTESPPLVRAHWRLLPFQDIALPLMNGEQANTRPFRSRCAWGKPDLSGKLSFTIPKTSEDYDFPLINPTAPDSSIEHDSSKWQAEFVGERGGEQLVDYRYFHGNEPEPLYGFGLG